MTWTAVLSLSLAAAAIIPVSGVPVGEKHPVDANAPAPAGTVIELPVSGGTPAKAYVAKPSGTPRGAVLVFHEWWGLNDWVKSEADALAKLGYLALAPDLYGGKVAEDPEEAGKLMGMLVQAEATKIGLSAIRHLQSSAPNVKVATIGWCMGGGQSLQASLAAGSQVAGTVIYYGIPESDTSKLKVLKGPVLGIYAKRDGWITPEVVAAFDKRLTEAGVKHEFHSYDADHGFANPTGGRHNPPAARDAWERTVVFLASVFRP